jgi:hypothetical protein
MESVRVLLDHYAEPAELDAARQALAEADVDAEVEGGYRKPTPGEDEGVGDEPEWIILILVSSTFGAFFVRFFGEAGADSWKGLKKLAEHLRDSRRRPTGSSIPPSPPHVGAIEFRDQYGNVIKEGLRHEGSAGHDAEYIPPDEFWRAWDHISEPDWSALGGWFVIWDYQRNAWAAFEPGVGSSRAVYWDRSAERWIDYEMHPVASFEPEPPRWERFKRRFQRRY